MHRKSYFSDGYWLWYHNGVSAKEIKLKACNETYDFLRESLGNLSLNELINTVKKDDTAQQKVVKAMQDKLNCIRAIVLPKEMRLALSIIEGSLDHHKPDTALSLNLTTTTGKWMVFLGRDIYKNVFTEVVQNLQGKSLDYTAKTLASPGVNERECPLIFYVPSFLAPQLIIETAISIIEVLTRNNIAKRPLMFKPDSFTYMNIYHETASIKPYIFICCRH